MKTYIERPCWPPLPVYPSRVVCNERELTETASDRRAVLTMRAAIDRDMLALAVDRGTRGDESDPDGWGVEFVREVAEYEAAMSGTYSLWCESYLIEAAAEDPEVGPRVRAIYRAVDRAYPYLNEEAGR